MTESPRAYFLREAKDGHLAYQVDERTGASVFYPRVDHEAARLRWARSGGKGSVYSVTVLHERDGTTRNLVLVDMDEGFRIMTTVRGVADELVAIGMRGRVAMEELEGESAPIFYAEGNS